MRAMTQVADVGPLIGLKHAQVDDDRHMGVAGPLQRRPCRPFLGGQRNIERRLIRVDAHDVESASRCELDAWLKRFPALKRKDCGERQCHPETKAPSRNTSRTRLTPK